MGQVLHGSARTTAAVRRAIQDSQASLSKLASHYGINAKTVAKWRKRNSVEDHGSEFIAYGSTPSTGSPFGSRSGHSARRKLGT